MYKITSDNHFQVDSNLPSRQKIPPLPAIDFSKYSSQFGTFEHVFSQQCTSNKPVTRKKKIDFGNLSTSNNSQVNIRLLPPINNVWLVNVYTGCFKKSATTFFSIFE